MPVPFCKRTILLIRRSLGSHFVLAELLPTLEQENVHPQLGNVLKLEVDLADDQPVELVVGQQ